MGSVQETRHETGLKLFLAEKSQQVPPLCTEWPLVRQMPGRQGLCPSELLCPAPHHVQRTESGSVYSPGHAPLGPSEPVGKCKGGLGTGAAETSPWGRQTKLLGYLDEFGCSGTESSEEGTTHLV